MMVINKADVAADHLLALSVKLDMCAWAPQNAEHHRMRQFLVTFLEEAEDDPPQWALFEAVLAYFDARAAEVLKAPASEQ